MGQALDSDESPTSAPADLVFICLFVTGFFPCIFKYPVKMVMRINNQVSCVDSRPELFQGMKWFKG